MAEVISIEVDSSKAFDKLAELKKSLEDINEKLAENTQEDAESVRQYEADLAVKKDLTRQQRELRKQLENSVRQQTQNSTSLKAMRAELSNLRQTYDELSATEREGAIGKNLQEQITRVNDALTAAEEATGRYQRNVGNYLGKVSEALKQNAGLFGGTMGTAVSWTQEAIGGFEKLKGSFQATSEAMKGTTGAVGKFKVALNALVGHPIIAVIVVVVGLLVKVWQTIQKSEAMTNRLKVAFAAFQPVLDLVENGFEALADVIVTVIEGYAKVAAAVMDFIGVQNAAGQSVKDYIGLEKAKIALEKENRDAVVQDAYYELQLAKLRDSVAANEKKNRAQARKDLESMNAIEAKQAAEKKARAEEALRILREEAKHTENSAEANNKIAEAEANVLKAETELYNKRREVTKKLAKFDDETRKEREAAEKKRQEAIKVRAEEAKKRSEEEQRRLAKEIADRQKAYQEELKATKAANDKFFQLQKERSERELTELDRVQKERILRMQLAGASEEEIANTQLELRRQTIMAKMAELVTEQTELQKRMDSGQLQDREAYEQRMREIRDGYATVNLENLQLMNDQRTAEEAKAAEAETKIEEEKTKAKTALQQSYNSLMQTSLGKSKEAVALQKTLATAQVAFNAARAISEAVASASSGDPYTIALRVAAAVISVTTAIAKATDAINSAGFATGGTVRGAGTGTSDSIPIRVSNGEAIMTARAVQMYAPMLSAMDQSAGGAPVQAVNEGAPINGNNFLGQQIAQAVAGIQPVVAVKDFIDVSNQLTTVKIAARVN